MIYDKHYFEHYLNLKGTPKEQELNEFRWSLVQKTITPLLETYVGSTDPASLTLVDYGCATGSFLESAPDYVSDHIVYNDSNGNPCGDFVKLPLTKIGVDINPFCVAYGVLNGQKVVYPEMFDYFYTDKVIDIMAHQILIQKQFPVAIFQILLIPHSKK